MREVFFTFRPQRTKESGSEDIHRFVKDFAPDDLVIDEIKLGSLMEKPCFSGKHDFRKLKTRFVSIDGELHSLRRHQEILRILSFRTLALDLNDSSLPEKVILVF